MNYLTKLMINKIYFSRISWTDELKHHLALCKPKFLYTVSALAKAAVEVTASSPCQVKSNWL